MSQFYHLKQDHSHLREHIQAYKHLFSLADDLYVMALLLAHHEKNIQVHNLRLNVAANMFNGNNHSFHETCVLQLCFHMG